MTSIIALLQLVIALLSSPNLSPDMKKQVFDMSTNAISLATKAIESQATVSVPPIQVNVPAFGGAPATVANIAPAIPPEPVVVPPPPIVEPTVPSSCQLFGKVVGWDGLNVSVQLDWTLFAIDPATPGLLYVPRGQSAGTVQYSPTPGPLDERTRNRSTYQLQPGMPFFKAMFGNVSCLAFFPDEILATRTPLDYLGAVSTSTAPNNMNY